MQRYHGGHSFADFGETPGLPIGTFIHGMIMKGTNGARTISNRFNFDRQNTHKPAPEPMIIPCFNWPFPDPDTCIPDERLGGT